MVSGQALVAASLARRGLAPVWCSGARIIVQLGAYTTKGEIGRGGMGVVLRGADAEGRPVAIKLLPREKDALALERFHREARILSSLGVDDGFVPLLDAGA